ncbi:hypothetical protein Ae263Ps1_2430 [Pseudonocardia sp. Ae263_Ps1]|nr:hypothetical protein Ae150APs1_2896c [Pseudonocardia sp. Ae150A_Ps1]OLL85375.1 hypothetical protein Ae263Ps1_2430 [Pseudonocardia sp. Ae263_Ps1]OLL94598.1 hypothetical protein Ae356Ps1_4495c [Pseudonocardia sp. Ae356_Ps1]
MSSTRHVQPGGGPCRESAKRVPGSQRAGDSKNNGSASVCRASSASTVTSWLDCVSVGSVVRRAVRRRDGSRCG